MSQPADQFDEPVLTPEASFVLGELETATAALGFPIAGHAKLNAVEDTLVGPDHAPVSLGPTIELTVSLAADGAPLPPPGRRNRNETAAAVMIVRVSPERSFGVLCWRAWVNLVEVSTARTFFTQQSDKADEHWDAVAAISATQHDGATDLDDQLDQAIAAITASLPRTPGDAISQAFGAVASDGHLTVGREWGPPISRLNYYDPDAAEAQPESADPPTTDSDANPDTDSSESAPRWTSSIALVGIAASVGLVIGLAVLWLGGRADADAGAGANPQPQPVINQLLSGTTQEGVEYDRVLAFRYRDRYYPVTLFKTVEPDLGCPVQHAHLATTETLARSFEAPQDAVQDPHPTGCGFGSLDLLQPAPYPIPREQLQTFCQTYRHEVPDWHGTATTALCIVRAPD